MEWSFPRDLIHIIKTDLKMSNILDKKAILRMLKFIKSCKNITKERRIIRFDTLSDN